MPPPPHWEGFISSGRVALLKLITEQGFMEQNSMAKKRHLSIIAGSSTHISRSFEISLGMQLSGIKIKNITQLRQNPTKKH